MKSTLRCCVSIILLLLACRTAGAGDFLTDTLGVRTDLSGNAADLLRGGLSGVRVSSIDGNPVGGLNINIRGINSIRSDNQPLWIVDGVMVSTSLNENLEGFWQYGEMSYTAPLNPLAFLNAADIESIEVIKDISATTIYGTRGAGGVVIVHTRRPHGTGRSVGFRAGCGLVSDASGVEGTSTGIDHNYNLSIDGNKDNTSYTVSGALRRISGTLPDNGSLYGTVRTGFDTHANAAVWFGLKSLLSLGTSSSPSGVTYLGQPSLTLALRDASLSPGTTAAQWSSDYDDDTEDIRALSSAYFRLNFTPSLYLNFSGGFDFQHNKRMLWYGSSTDLGAPGAGNQYGGAASTLVSQLFGYNAAAELTCNRYFSTIHHVKATLQADLYGNSNRFNTMNGVNFVSHELRAYGLKLGAFDTTVHDFIRDSFHEGGYAMLSYDCDGIAGINAVLRVDRTPKYGDNELNLFPSAEAFFDVRKAFFASSGTVSTLRLDAGWGRSGKEQYVPYELFGSYLTSAWYEPEEGTSTFYDGLSRLSTQEMHIGALAGFAADRLTLGVTWFDKSTDDSFLMYRMGNPPEDPDRHTWTWGGCEEVFDRTTTVSNRGFEFDLYARPVSKRDWRWEISANATKYANLVTAQDSSDFHGRKVGSDIFCTCNGVNLPVSTLYGYMVDESGYLVDITEDKRIDEADMMVLGYTVPTFHGGIESVLGFRNLTLDVCLEWATGQNVADLNSLVKNGVKGPDGITVLTSAFVRRGDWLRVSRAGLKYRVPLNVKWVKEMDLRLSCNNLATLTYYDGWNPDVNCFGVSPLAAGLDYGSYPLTRTVMLGASLKF